MIKHGPISILAVLNFTLIKLNYVNQAPIVLMTMNANQMNTAKENVICWSVTSMTNFLVAHH